jgi:hypothetical protein
MLPNGNIRPERVKKTAAVGPSWISLDEMSILSFIHNINTMIDYFITYELNNQISLIVIKIKETRTLDDRNFSRFNQFCLKMKIKKYEIIE